MKRLFSFAAIALLAASAPATAQSDTLPSSGSTAGVTILGNGRSLSPAALTPTGPRTPQGFPPAWMTEEPKPLVADSQLRRRR